MAIAKRAMSTVRHATQQSCLFWADADHPMRKSPLRESLSLWSDSSADDKESRGRREKKRAREKEKERECAPVCRLRRDIWLSPSGKDQAAVHRFRALLPPALLWARRHGGQRRKELLATADRVRH